MQTYTHIPVHIDPAAQGGEVKSRHATITSSELQKKVGTILKRVAIGKERLVVEREGYPVAVIVPYEQGIVPEAEKLLDALPGELGPALAAKGIMEENLVDHMRNVRKTLHQQKYGKTKKA